MLHERLAELSNGQRAGPPYPTNPLPPTERKARKAGDVAAQVATRTKKPVEVPRDANCDPNSPDAPWRRFPMPFGKQAGVKLAALDKNYLFGLWANYEVKDTWTGRDGVERPSAPDKIVKDRLFRSMLDEAGKHYEFTHPDEESEEADQHNRNDQYR
jgi:hypothetical protein